MLMASNRSLAEYNLQQQPVLESRKHQLYEAHQNKATIQRVFEKNRQKLGKVSLIIYVTHVFRIMFNFRKQYVLLVGTLESDNEEAWVEVLVKVTAFFSRNIRQDNLLSIHL